MMKSTYRVELTLDELKAINTISTQLLKGAEKGSKFVNVHVRLHLVEFTSIARKVNQVVAEKVLIV